VLEAKNKSPTINTEIVETLRRDGAVVLPQRFAFVNEFIQHLSNKPVYQNHVRQGRPDPVPIGSHPWTSYDIWDVISAPEFLETAISFIPIAESYLESPSVLYSFNAFNCEPNHQPKRDIQDWHRDADDVRFLALFMYCTDVVDENDGPHQFIRGTHQGRPDTGECVTILGPAGTLFLSDTSNIHRGLMPKRKRRTIAWARWGVSVPPASYGWDKLSPLPRAALGDRYPDDPRTRETIRFIAA